MPYGNTGVFLYIVGSNGIIRAVVGESRVFIGNNFNIFVVCRNVDNSVLFFDKIDFHVFGTAYVLRNIPYYRIGCGLWRIGFHYHGAVEYIYALAFRKGFWVGRLLFSTVDKRRFIGNVHYIFAVSLGGHTQGRYTAVIVGNDVFNLSVVKHTVGNFVFLCKRRTRNGKAYDCGNGNKPL